MKKHGDYAPLIGNLRAVSHRQPLQGSLPGRIAEKAQKQWYIITHSLRAIMQNQRADLAARGFFIFAKKYGWVGVTMGGGGFKILRKTGHFRSFS